MIALESRGDIFRPGLASGLTGSFLLNYSALNLRIAVNDTSHEASFITKSIPTILWICTLFFLAITIPMNHSVRSNYRWLTYSSVNQHGSASEQSTLEELKDRRSKNTMIQAGLSAILLISGLWVILSKRYSPTDRHWAYGILGMIAGFWFGNAP